MVRRGFTLTELLVVISLMCMLVGLLLPALAKGRASSHTATCGIRQHQIAVALTSFAGDWFDVLPREGIAPWMPEYQSGGAGFVPWVEATTPYLAGAGGPSGRWSPIYQDPAHPNPNHLVHYAMNGVSFAEDATGRLNRASATRRPAVQASRIRFPSRMAYLTTFTDDRDNSIAKHAVSWGLKRAAGIYDVWNPPHLWGPDTGSDPSASNVRRIGLDRHPGGNNVLFPDMHVSRLPSAELIDAITWYDGVPHGRGRF